jgi:signal transduction histidine kinase
VVLLINNLVSNALKFIAPGVQPQIRLSAEASGDWARLSVQDNGIGIGKADQEKIFAAFQRLHGKQAYPGTGLGLAIVRKGAERMGGRVGVESEPGKGSRFWVELKAVGPANAPCP